MVCESSSSTRRGGSTKLNNVENHPVSIMHGDSINYKGLQIADLISWSVFQKAEHQNAKYIDLMENKKNLWNL